MSKIASKKQLESGDAFKVSEKDNENFDLYANSSVKYDLVGKLTEGTGLTRRSIVDILTGIQAHVFDQFSHNPEEFIIRISALINEQKASAIIQHITYDKLDECHSSSIFTDRELKGQMGVNAMSVDNHLFDYLIYDSKIEREFAKDIDKEKDVAVYVKLPTTFYINTPLGKYSPDWAIAFEEGSVKHIYFIAETKGSLSSLNLDPIESGKKKCAEKHFKAISNDRVKYDVVSSYEELLNIVLN